MTTNVPPGWQQQHSHNGSLAAVDRLRCRCRRSSSSRKIDPDTLVSFYFTHSFAHLFRRQSIPPFPVFFFFTTLRKFFLHQAGVSRLSTHFTPWRKQLHLSPRTPLPLSSLRYRRIPVVTFPPSGSFVSHEFLHVDSEVGRR